METFDLAVIGEGVTGLTAAQAAAKAGLRVATFETHIFGGLVINLNHLVDCARDGGGADFASELSMQCNEAGVTSHSEEVTGIEVSGTTKIVRTASGGYGARAVIIASGAKIRRLGIPGELDFEYRGVSQCADCDGPMFQDQDIVVVGGGDAALQEAAVLAGYAKSVHLLHRGTAFRARPSLQEAIRSHANVHVHFQTVAEAVIGDSGVDKVRVKQLADGTTREIPCAGFFAFPGLEPNSGFAPQAITRDAAGALVADANLATPVAGVYVAGAVRSGYSGRLDDAIAEGGKTARAAIALVSD